MITEVSGRPASVSEFTKLSHTSCPGTNCSIVWVSLSVAASYLLCFSQLSHVRICTWIGGMRPRKSFKMRFSEITSKVTFGPKCYWNFYFSPTCYNGSEQRCCHGNRLYCLYFLWWNIPGFPLSSLCGGESLGVGWGVRWKHQRYNSIVSQSVVSVISVESHNICWTLTSPKFSNHDAQPFTTEVHQMY